MTDDAKPQIPVLNENDEPANGADLGSAEALSLGRGLDSRDLRREAEEADHDRNERFKGHFDNIGVAFLYVAALGLLLMGGVWFWHIVTPWHFLQESQISRLQNLLTGGVVVSVGVPRQHQWHRFEVVI